MVQRCNFCSSYQEIVYRDYAPATKQSPSLSVSVCWRCFAEFKMGQNVSESQTENMDDYPGMNKIVDALQRIKELFPKMLLCSTCQEKFIPNRPGRSICYPCWKKSQVKTEQKEIWGFA